MIVIRLLAAAARHGRLILVAGLLAGILLPELALAMKDWIAELIAGLLFISALRVGPRQAVGALAEARASFGLALIYQIAIPAAATLAFALCGWKSALATGLILMMAASPISGAPNLAILTGNDPAPALRQLVIGTALLPLTVLPVFWLAPALGETGEVFKAAGRLLIIIGTAAGAAFLIRGFFLKTPSRSALDAIDGLSAVAMAIVVIGLMSAVGPALRGDPALLAAALAASFIGNFGLQIIAALVLRRLAPDRVVASLAITAGNRNIALFLTALPASVTDQLLLFIGCYQIPMYLTPLLLGRFYRSREPG